MSLQNLKNTVGSLTIGAAGGFCATAFMSAMYGIGYLPVNWLGASHNFSVVAGVVSTVGLGAITTVGVLASGVAGAASIQEKFGIYDVKGWPLTGGLIAGAVGGFKAAAVVGSLVTFDNDRDTSHLVPTETHKPQVTYTI